MYPDVQEWLEQLLRQGFKKKQVKVFITGNRVLSKVLEENNLHKFFPSYQTYEIQVDVVGIVSDTSQADLAFIECKLGNISLKDISQLLGYSRVAKPLMSLIISPEGVSYAVNLLLNVHRRDDVLSFPEGKAVRIAKWMETRKDLDMSSLIPRGASLY